jgi:hypothetical protein
VCQYQVVHSPDGLRVRVVLRQEAPADASERTRSALLAELDAAGAAPSPVTVEPVEVIEREPGLGAKLRLVKSTVPPRGP